MKVTVRFVQSGNDAERSAFTSPILAKGAATERLTRSWTDAQFDKREVGENAARSRGVAWPLSFSRRAFSLALNRHGTGVAECSRAAGSL